ncbi:hypothetical protein [Streptomyces sp. HC307]|uniref:hypothetical protein n=1 Tax=Streptomyces flavusporus TaxID=3385496 RepID=UPI003917285D
MSEPGALPVRGEALHGQQLVFRAVTTITGTVVGLAFLFGFGNVWTLALRLGVSGGVAPLVAPAVDLSVVALLLAIRYLALSGAPAAALRPARRLLLLTQSADTGPQRHRAAARRRVRAGGLRRGRSPAPDRPGRGRPRLLQAISGICAGTAEAPTASEDRLGRSGRRLHRIQSEQIAALGDDGDELLARARAEDALHWQIHRRPISAETLRKRLHIGAARSRSLVAILRTADAPEDKPVLRTVPGCGTASHA